MFVCVCVCACCGACVCVCVGELYLGGNGARLQMEGKTSIDVSDQLLIINRAILYKVVKKKFLHLS